MNMLQLIASQFVAQPLWPDQDLYLFATATASRPKFVTLMFGSHEWLTLASVGKTAAPNRAVSTNSCDGANALRKV